VRCDAHLSLMAWPFNSIFKNKNLAAILYAHSKTNKLGFVLILILCLILKEIAAFDSLLYSYIAVSGYEPFKVFKNL
jgi:hypothetical protein